MKILLSNGMFTKPVLGRGCYFVFEGLIIFVIFTIFFEHLLMETDDPPPSQNVKIGGVWSHPTKLSIPNPNSLIAITSGVCNIEVLSAGDPKAQ